ncbi:MAG: sulfotransferase [Planctomycetes bacterium]|nr:sulfotransferase [Planctomycetota bacterium]
MEARPEPLLFVVGAPRSGTTLLRAMLNRHSRIGLCDETFFFYWVANRQRVFGDLADPARRARAVDRFLETRRVIRLGLDLAELRAALLREATSYPRFFAALLRFCARAAGKTIAGEKTPQHALEARTLLDWYPEARLLHLIRDPRDVVASLRRMPWGAGSRLGDACTWRDCVAGAEACAADPRFLRLRYEDLIEAPEQELRRICAALGIAFESVMLEGSGRKTDRWWFDRAQGAIEKGRVERWRSELTADDIAVVEAVAGEALGRHGYVPAAPPATPAQMARARREARMAGMRRRIRHLPATFWRLFRPDLLAREERAVDGPADPVA